MNAASIAARVRWHNRRGFTLIELMAAMVVMAVGLFSVIQLQLVSIRGTSYAQERSGAQEIANGVAMEILTRSLQWADAQPTVGPGSTATFAGTFGTDIMPVEVPDNAATMIPWSDVHAIPSYLGKTIGNGNIAQLINTVGCSSLSSAHPDCQNIGSKGQLYRVHYTAENVYLKQGDVTPSPDLVRITLFVSWDNKDHGLSYDWKTIDGTNFWDRHMVAVTFLVSRNQLR
jgi:prepilin-type N-terminal cleavage/methylation domain-containing protein